MNEEKEFSNLSPKEQKRMNEQLWDSINEKAIWRLNQRYCSECETMLLDHNETDFCSICRQIIINITA